MSEPQISTNIDFSALYEQHSRTAAKLKKQPIKARRAKLKVLKRWLLDHQDEIRAAEYLDLKKPQDEVNVTELYPVLTEVRHAIAKIYQWTRPDSVGGSLTFLGTSAYIHYEPKGTSLIISPWNYPLLLAVGPLISAVAAGNTVVLKPSEFTPATNKVISQMVREVFTQDEVLLVEGEADVAASLLKLPFDHIFFTGSPQVGKIVMAAAAQNLTSVTLELGGKSPTIIDQTASLKDAAGKVAWAKWTNAGQTCVAPDYLFVHEKVAQRFIGELKKAADKMYAEKKDYTSIINVKHYERLSDTLADALEKGANLLMEGSNSPEELSIGPIILGNVNDDMRIMQEEIFGPVLPVMIYQHLDQVIDYINQRPKPLALYLYSKSSTHKKRILNETSSGSLVFNDSVVQFGHPQLQMGGVNNSGIGKAHGHAGFLEFTHQKSVMRQMVGFTIASTVRPPYSNLKKKLIQLMLKYF